MEKSASALFLKNLAESIKKENPAVLRNSRFGQWISDSFSRSQKRTADCLSMSPTANYAGRIKREFQSSLIKISGIILLSAAIVTLVLSFIFHYKFGITGLIVRLMLLIVGFCGLYFDIRWAAIKKGSALSKILFR